MAQGDTWEMGLPEMAAILTVVIGVGIIHSIMTTYGITFDRTVELIKISLAIGGIAGLGIGWQFSKGKKWWGIAAGIIAAIGTVRLGWFVWAEMGWSMLLSAAVGAVIVVLAINGGGLAIGLMYVEWQNRKRRSRKERKSKSQNRSSTNSAKRARADRMKDSLNRRERQRERERRFQEQQNQNQSRYQDHVPRTTREGGQQYRNPGRNER